MPCGGACRDRYSRLFHWVLDKINSRDRSALDVLTEKLHVLQFIDVPGFEKLSLNSLEQLFINIVDEVRASERVCASERACVCASRWGGGRASDRGQCLAACGAE